MKNFILLSLLMLLNSGCFSQGKSNNLLEDLLESRSDLFGEILKNQEAHRLQIIYTQINRDSLNHPSFQTFEYGIKPDSYFYPASTVKLPAALLALEKLNELQIDRLNKDTPLRILAAREPQEAVEEDSTAKNGLPSISQYIRKIFLVSDNDAFNRIYEFLGQSYLNEKLWEKGFTNLRIIHRLANSDFDPKANRYTNPLYFYQGKDTLYQQEEQYNDDIYPPRIEHYYVGKAHYDRGRFVKKPFNFKEKNYLAIRDMHAMLQVLMFPEAFPKEKRFGLNDEDYAFIYRSMGMFPRESIHPSYKKKEHTDDFSKYFLYSEDHPNAPPGLRIFNKVGLAYGFMIDNAYIVDFEQETEYLLTAIIYVNENQTLNDNKYQYEEIGFPFFSNLAKVISWHEKNRPRPFRPDLGRFQLDFQN